MYIYGLDEYMYICCAIILFSAIILYNIKAKSNSQIAINYDQVPKLCGLVEDIDILDIENKYILLLCINKHETNIKI